MNDGGIRDGLRYEPQTLTGLHEKLARYLLILEADDSAGWLLLPEIARLERLIASYTPHSGRGKIQ